TRRQFSHKHGKAAVSNEGNTLPVRTSDLSGYRIWQAGSHGCEVSRQRMHLASFRWNLSRPPGRDCSRITGNDGSIRQSFPELPCNALRFHRSVHPCAVGFHDRPPLPHSRLCFFQKLPIFISLQQRQQPLQSPSRISDQAYLDWISETDPHWIQLELNPSCLPGLRKKFNVRERRSNHK